MRPGKAAGAAAVLILTCIFGVTLLMGIFAGAAIYQRVSERVAGSAEDRVGLTYITAKLHGFDALQPDGSPAVRAGTVAGHDALFLQETIDGVSYETILYVYDGQLREMLCLRGDLQDPAFGEVIGPARSLRIEEPGTGLLRLEYPREDGRTNTACVFLRSGGSQWGNG